MAIETMLLGLGLLLLVAKIFGEATERIGVTSLVGQIVAGIVLGPILFEIWGIVLIEQGPFFSGVIDLGIIFILFMAGLAVRFEDVKNHVYTASALAVAGGLLSFVLGFAVGFFMFNSIIIGVAIGIIFISTGDGVLFTLLRKFGEIRTRLGKMVIAVTAADDIMGILALSFFTFFIFHGSIAVDELFKLFLIAIGFYLVILSVGTRIVGKILDWSGNLLDEQILFSVPLGIVFLLAVLSQNIGLGIATGAFLGGMTMARHRFTDDIITPKIKVMADGFIIPLFYAAVGTLLTFAGLDILLVIILTVAAVVAKYVGSGLCSSFFRIRGEDKKMIGLFMIPRGDYNIAVAQIALSLGVFAGLAHLYTSIIFAIIITVIITPVLFRLIR